MTQEKNAPDSLNSSVVIETGRQMTGTLVDGLRDIHGEIPTHVPTIRTMSMESEQADALVAVHGLIDSLYLKELAKKVKRGLAGQMDRGILDRRPPVWVSQDSRAGPFGKEGCLRSGRGDRNAD